VSLEQNFRWLAAQLEPEHWRTPAYEQLILASQAGDLEVLETLRGRFMRVWEYYLKTPVSEAEVTEETVVGHRLLQEGLEGWLHALDQLEASAFGRGLQAAESANRLLVAAQLLSRAVTETSPVPEDPVP
jgi:hypothetical protein